MRPDSGGAGMAPFEKHPADVGAIETQAGDFERLAGKALDLKTVTDTAFKPAEADWDGMCAEELRAAPEPVRKGAQETSSALAWAATPLRFWKAKVTAFNTEVDRISGALSSNASKDYGAKGTDGKEPTDAQVADARMTAEANARQQWWTAYNANIVDGADSAAAMFRDGPTEANLKAARDVGALPATPGVFSVFPAYWHQVNMEAAAKRADELAKKIKDPTYVPTDAELDELRNLVKQYSNDKIFAYNFLNDLGPKGLLELNGTLATYQMDYPGTDKDDFLFSGNTADIVKDLQIGLGVALATATTSRGTKSGPPGSEQYYPGKYELSTQWTTDLMIAGREKMNIGNPANTALYVEGVYGYQLLSPLLRNGDYDARFLSTVGGDIVDFEMQSGKNSALWTEARSENIRLDWTQGHDDNTAPAGYDPVNALMSQLSHNGKATQDLLTGISTYTTGADQPIDGRLPRLDYLLTDRNWDGGRDTPGGPGWTAELYGNEDKYKNIGLDDFGKALEVATIPESNPESRHIVGSIIYEINVDEGAMGIDQNATGEEKTKFFQDTDLINPELRASLGRITAAYITDVNLNIADGHPVDSSKNFDVPKQEYMVRFLADLGKDPDARAAVTHAEVAFAAHENNEILSGRRNPNDDLDDKLRAMSVVSHEYGGVVGALDFGATAANSTTSEQMDKEFNQGVEDRYKVIGTVVDKLVGTATDKIPVPLVGDYVGDQVTGLVDEFKNSEMRDSSGRTAFENGQTIGAGRHDAVDITELSLYNSGQLEGLPPELVQPNGDPKPVAEWSKQDYDLWNNYKGHGGQSTVGDAAKNAGNEYQLGYDWAKKIANGG